ncbi:DUF3168 domain-containing protein [Actinomadura sp. NPDC049382]|uniref:DUF3168 domain-containing protein n=1 Tax=Actinomadura sp. NPDC049382 TaxID=3158220 RepID=UPI003415CD51
MTVPVTPLGPIQEAVYDVLTGDATLTGLIEGVFDEIPEGTPYPYVVIGEALEQPDNSHDRFGRQTVLTLHVWTDYRGFSKATEITSRLVSLLDHQPLTIPGHHHVSTRYEFSQTLRDPEPHVRHIPIRFRVITEQV